MESASNSTVASGARVRSGSAVPTAELPVRIRGNGHCVCFQLVRIDTPFGLDAAGEVDHGIGFDADGGDALAFGLDHRGAGAAERIQHNLARLQVETHQVLPHQVGRKGEHKPIPVMKGPVVRLQFIRAVVCSDCHLGKRIPVQIKL